MKRSLGSALNAAIARLAVRLHDASRAELALEAEVLLAHVLQISRARLLARLDQDLGRSEIAKFFALIRRRRQRVPSAYLRGVQEFWSLEFAVGPGVLVPRPETELLVERTLALVPRPLRILDVGTGSGCIAIALARELPAARVIAIDRSAAALSYASMNARRHGVAERVTFLQADLCDLGALFVAESFDAIVANPPYVEPGAIRDEIAHEPRLALVGESGEFPAVYRQLSRLLPRLRTGGALLAEVGAGQCDGVAAIFRSATPTGRVESVSDAAGIERCVIVRR